MLLRSYSWTSEISAPLKKSSCKGFTEEELGTKDDEERNGSDDVSATEEEIAADVGATDDDEACAISLDDRETADENTSDDESEVNDDEVFSATSADELGATTVDEDKIIEEKGETSEELLNSNSEASEDDSINPKLEYCEFSIGVEAGSSPHPCERIARETHAKPKTRLFSKFILYTHPLIGHKRHSRTDESPFILKIHLICRSSKFKIVK